MFASLRKNTWIQECKNGRSAIHIQNMLYTVESRRMKSWSPKRSLKNSLKRLYKDQNNPQYKARHGLKVGLDVHIQRHLLL